MTTARSFFLLSAAALCPAALALAADRTIADLAPPEAIVVVGVDSGAEFRDALEGSMLGAMWRDQEIHAWLESFVAEDEDEGSPGQVLKEAREALERAGVEEDELHWPTGMAGYALWFARGTEEEHPEPRYFFAADFADDAGDMRDAFVSMADQIEEEDDDISIERDEHGAASVWTFTIKMPPIPQIRFDEDWQDAGDAGMGDEEPEWDMVETDPRIVVAAWTGSYVVVANDRAAMEHAVDRIEGAANDSVADSQDFQRSLGQIGDSDAYAFAALAPLIEMLAEERGPMDVGPILETLGLDGLRAASAGLRLKGAGGAIEQTFAVLAPKKSGVVALFDGKLDAFSPPPSVGADATSVYMFRFDYAQLFPTLNRAIASIPDEAERQQAQMMLGFMAGGLQPLLAGMSPETTISNTIRKPYSLEPDPMSLAVGVTDEAAIKGGIESMAAMLQFEARDFQGNQMWASPMGVALGLGSGRLYAGPVEAVENALRQAGQNDALRLADEDRFKRAASFTKPGAMFYMWTDFTASLDKSAWAARNYKDQIRKDLIESGWDPAEVNDFMQGLEDGPMEKFLQRMPASDVFGQYMGDTVGEMRSTDDGFHGRWLTLPPQ